LVILHENSSHRFSLLRGRDAPHPRILMGQINVKQKSCKP
jgi:hypothetical protein